MATRPDDSTEPHYWEIAERVFDGFYRVSVDGVIQRVSPKAVELMGYDSAEDMIGKVSMADIWVHPSERNYLVQELREHGVVRSFEATFKRRDGSLIRVEMSVAPVLDADGNLIANDGVLRDVSERSRSEQQFRSLVKSSPGAIFRYIGGDAPRFSFMSDAITGITGYPVDFFTGRGDPFQQLTGDEDRKALQALVSGGFEPGEEYSIELEIRTRDGEPRWIQIKGIASEDALSGERQVDGLILDVTEAHRVSQELAESELQVRSLVRNSPGAIYHFAEGEDGVWRFAYMSPAIEDVTGYPPEFFIGATDPFEQILHPDDREPVAAEFADAIARGGEIALEHRILHRDGSVRWLRVQGSWSRDPNHGRGQLIGVQMDVSDLHEARQALERSEATFRHLFDSMAEGYWVTDTQGVIQMANSAAARILGFPDGASLEGRNSLEFLVDPTRGDAITRELREQRIIESYELELQRPDGRVITANFSTRVDMILDELRSESTFRDVTRQKQIEAEIIEARYAAEQANRAKSTFLANMSHELRTPLNAIIGYSEMLIEEAEDLDNAEFADDLGKIRTAGTHLLALINDVLDLSKIEAGKSELFVEPFALEELIDSVVTTSRPLFEKNHNTLTLDVGEGAGEVTLEQDLTKLRQALLNLLSNAAKFTREGTVTLTSRVAETDGVPWLSLSVRDTGIGIPAESMDKLFDEFSQADASTTREFGGTGLGLAISRRFCRMMGGDISVASLYGEGSTFEIRVPLRAPAGQDASAQGAANQGTTARESARPTDSAAESGDRPLPAVPARTVLVIDDDPEACEIIAHHLTRSGFEAVVAHSGEQGLALARDIRPCAITLDVMMPEMDGWSVLSSLQADPELAAIPVVMVSMVDDRSAGYTLGATGYLTKPVDRDDLLRAIRGTGTTTGSVLIIEDDADTRAMLARILTQAGFGVTEADNGEAGLQALARAKPDLILLDLMMPVMDGFDFLLQLRADPAMDDVAVVVVTAKDLDEDEHALLTGRVAHVLEKGAYTREQLLGLVRTALANLG